MDNVCLKSQKIGRWKVQQDSKLSLRSLFNIQKVILWILGALSYRIFKENIYNEKAYKQLVCVLTYSVLKTPRNTELLAFY